MMNRINFKDMDTTAINDAKRIISQMKDIRKELNRFVKPVQIEVINSDFEMVSFRELR